MSDALLSGRYSRALFNLSKKAGNLPEVDRALSVLLKTTEEFPNIAALIQTPTLKESEKNAFIEKVLSPETPSLLKDFLKVLIEKKRFSLLKTICAEFHELFEEEQGILEVEVLSVIPLAKTIEEKLKKVLETKLRAVVRLAPKIDASLIGGFLLRFGGREIDCSYKNRIREIEQQLLTT